MHNLEPIKSRDNARLVALRKIRDGHDRTRIFIEGKRLVAEALRSSIDLGDCFIEEGRIAGELISELKDRGAEIHHVESKIFPTISDTKTPQGIVVTATRPAYSLDDLADDTEAKAPLIFLSEINNPANLGALIRTAEAAGVAGICLSKGSADPFSPKAIRGSMGSIFRLKVVEGVDLADLGRQTKAAGRTSVALDISGKIAYTDVDWLKPKLVVFGSEANGLHDDDLALIDQKVLIPMENGVESLNLAVSAGIVLFEAKRQRSSGLR